MVFISKGIKTWKNDQHQYSEKDKIKMKVSYIPIRMDHIKRGDI